MNSKSFITDHSTPLPIPPTRWCSGKNKPARHPMAAGRRPMVSPMATAKFTPRRTETSTGSKNHASSRALLNDSTENPPRHRHGVHLDTATGARAFQPAATSKSMTRQFVVIILLVLASLAAPCLLHRSTQRAWSERNQTLHRQARQLAALSGEHQRLSNLIATAKPPLPTDQFTELLRLRGEIGRLRQAAKEPRQLRAANQEALASPGSSAAPAPTDPANI